jgi:transposase
MYSRSAPRRRHNEEFKARVLADCDEPGASISGVALAHGLNANLVRQWRAGRGAKLAGTAVAAPSAAKGSRPPKVNSAPQISAGREFVAIEMPAPPKPVAAVAIESTPPPAPREEQHVLVELRRGSLHLNVRWPTAAVDDCRAWLRELAAGLAK